MCEAFWQAKIWGLVDNLDLNTLKNNAGNEATPYFNALEASRSSSPVPSTIHQNADLITDASDRAVLNIAYRHFHGENRIIFGGTDTQELTVTHLLSGKKLTLWVPLSVNSNSQTSATSTASNNSTTINHQQLFWWLWRCLPELVCQHNQSLMLTPAAKSLPDASVWSHNSLRAAMAGTLATYGRTPQRQQQSDDLTPRPYLAIFSFTPVQEIVKSSRKMRDFWAGSWVLHYLSAKICWELAQHYGPDSLIYPSLYQQPLIDHWLRGEYETFTPWIDEPSSRDLLTAGFPNVIVALLPRGEVKAAMQTAKQTLLKEWLKLGNLVFTELQQRRWIRGTRELSPDSRTWNGWLKAQWQPYWVALPLGANGEDLTNQSVFDTQDGSDNPWLKAQNATCNLGENSRLFNPQEFDFIQAVKQNLSNTPVSVNVGSWWPYLFDQLRFGLSAVKNSRTWDIPTAFSPRSTISGIGPVVYPDSNEHQPREKNQHRPITEAQTKDFWQEHAGLFDGIEQLNATETLKRGIHRILSKKEVLGLEERQLNAAYPDLTAGAAGYLRVNYPKNDPQRKEHFRQTCASVLQQLDKFPDAKRKAFEDMKWGIPGLERQHPDLISCPPRLLNAGWLVADLDISEPDKPDYRTELQKHIAQFYPNNNPTDWYVLAAGDGDGMSRWLKGLPLKNYQDYMPSASPLPDTAHPKIHDAFNHLKGLQKRMGPSTHNALSRALLDFSNKLLPYLTEQRYTGRLIYGGGDDVLAYTNLWEWDKWLWDVRQCFRGADDQEYQEFNNEGDYWQWQGSEPPAGIPKRPLFTMGSEATISFGIVIAHHSVPLAIALENLWDAEEKAKEHSYTTESKISQKKEYFQKNAVQVRVLYGNGNSLNATSKFEVFRRWRSLLNLAMEPALFEQAAQIWSQHPAPNINAIAPWTQAFCNRRELFKGNEALKNDVQQQLEQFLCSLHAMTQAEKRETEIQNWLKLAAFVLRKREIKIKWQGES
ncbi:MULTISPECIES: type III-B CRISPR-associated protein Cas10/Cmr2 [unclassified Coleofasciculus]|uniref:type III-B CRISPR-associated protein Cas10/Cmr2 n=1 Tax=unclassified Coleofasciculus TaxID=2692782 RepID=UPI0018807BC6|nr:MULTISPECIES: type III-B CRISPR-associated protein Cas10/Cmr2 [unclassified Coleofasciculus]MBE9129433.1 type III-B CRISPR-associated protein Cas10/Cmr2 [Coleofasciculus sp. LEGE 07081]MBE9152157.1 type III-B CRISPR-associated protein Cas10/Cmr2 [Coleofasciculus sp. LEGE 07092]